MRSRSIVILLAVAAVGSLLGGLGTQVRAQDTRPGIAVFMFDVGGSVGQEKQNFDGLQRGMPGMLISELAATPAVRLVEREQVQHLLDEQNLGAAGRVDAQTAAKIGKIVGAKYAITGMFMDFSGDFRLDIFFNNTATTEIVRVEADKMSRDHLFDLIRTLAQRLTTDVSLPPLPSQASEQRVTRQVPTEALTYYSRALLYHDRGQRDKAIEMYTRALEVFPEYAEAQQGLQREKNS